MRKLLSLLLAVTLLLSLGTVSASAESASTFGLTPLTNRTTLRIGFFAGSVHSVMFWVADHEGFFDELNMDVEYVQYDSGPTMMEDHANWDIADVGGPGALSGMKGYNVKTISICDYEENRSGLFVRPDSAIAQDPSNPEVWKGTEWVLPTGTTMEYTLLAQLNKLGLTAADVTITHSAVGTAYTAFQTGSADGIGVWNMYYLRALEQGWDMVADGTGLGLTIACTLCATDEALTDKYDAVVLGNLLYYLTWEWCQASPENMATANQMYVDSCDWFGIAYDSEEQCAKLLSMNLCPATAADAIALMTEYEDDYAGKYTTRQLLKGENDVLETLDFFIDVKGSYSAEDRVKMLDNNMFDSSVCTAGKALLEAIGYYNK